MPASKRTDRASLLFSPLVYLDFLHDMNMEKSKEMMLEMKMDVVYT